MSIKPRTTRAPNNAGSIRKRADGRWEGTVTIGVDPGTGKQLRRSVYGRTMKEVVVGVQRMRISLADGMYTEPSKMTVGAWLNLWHRDYLGSVKPATKVTYASQIRNHLKPAFAAVKLVDLKPIQVQRFYNNLTEKGLSAKTVKGIHGVLHKALSQAIKLNYIRTNPTHACELPRIEKPNINYMDSEAIAAFLEAIKGHAYEAMFKVAMFTGMRLGELLGLTWDRVDFKRGRITIDRQLLRPRTKGEPFQFGSLKNDKPCIIMPATTVFETLKEHRSAQVKQRLLAGPLWIEEPDFVFTNEFGRHASYWKLSKHLNNILKGLGLSRMRFHDLRHTYAVIAITANVNTKALQENLGHHSAAFTLDVYGHMMDELRRESGNQVEAFIQGIKKAE